MECQWFSMLLQSFNSLVSQMFYFSQFTAVSDPTRHLKAAEIMGANISNVKEEDAVRLAEWGDHLLAYRWCYCVNHEEPVELRRAEEPSSNFIMLLP